MIKKLREREKNYKAQIDFMKDVIISERKAYERLMERNNMLEEKYYQMLQKIADINKIADGGI